MTFVTRLRLSGGDRAALDRVVEEIRSSAQRKGVQLKGPHSHPPETLSVPQYKRSPPGWSDGEGDGHGGASDEFDPWRYAVYRREMEIVGHESFARRVAQREFPASVHVEFEVDRRTGVGG